MHYFTSVWFKLHFHFIEVFKLQIHFIGVRVNVLISWMAEFQHFIFISSSTECGPLSYLRICNLLHIYFLLCNGIMKCNVTRRLPKPKIYIKLINVLTNTNVEKLMLRFFHPRRTSLRKKLMD